jgi:AAA+ ATPase superfamily predicted ATPase
MGKPEEVFDREWEWDVLSSFADRDSGLGVVSGRRRHGKSFLLRALAAERGALYHQAIEIDRVSGLRRFASVLATVRNWPAAPVFDGWEQALRATFADSGDGFVILDEFPYLVREAPELLSIIQLLVDEWRQSRARHRLILCGSSLSVMGTVLAGASPIHGRATLDLSLSPFDYRTAADYWHAPNERVAFVVDAIVGGAPGYRDLMSGSVPHRLDQLGNWLASGPLNPAHVLFSEDDYLLREEAQFTDRAQYLSILRAIAHGASTNGAIAAALGRDARSLHHALNGLVRAGFVESIDDALRDQRPIYRLVDPPVRFCQLVTRPSIDRLEQHDWQAVLAERQSAIAAGVYGPHFEHICREWVRRFASPDALGGTPTRVAPAVLSDPVARAKHQIDVVAVRAGFGDRPVVLAIGEAKHTNHPRGAADVARLDRARDLIRRTRNEQFDTNSIRLMLFSANGFDATAKRLAAARDDLTLVDLERLYERAPIGRAIRGVRS